MANIEVVSSNGKCYDIINRNIQKGEKGKLKGKQFVVYRNKRYIVEEGKFGLPSIYPWGLVGYE